MENFSTAPAQSRIPKNANPALDDGKGVQSRIPKNASPTLESDNEVQSKILNDADPAAVKGSSLHSRIPKNINSEASENLSKIFGLTEDENTEFVLKLSNEAKDLAKKYGLTAKEATAIRMYTDNNYYIKINNQFRNLPLAKVDTTNSLALQSLGVVDDCLAEIIASLVSGMKKLPPAHLDDACIRGLGRMVNLRDDLDSYQEGAEIDAESFISSSVSTKELTRENWWNRKAHMAVIRQRVEGNGRDISAFSEYPGEEEICFIPNTRFKILYRSEEVDTPPGYSLEKDGTFADYDEKTEKFRKKIFIVMQEIKSD